MDIEVTPEVIPLFDPIGPLSQNSTPPALPDTSLNGITGTWDPSLIDTSVPGTYTYTFTPDEGQCAGITDMEITVLFDVLYAITGAGGHCLTGAAIVPLVVDHFTSVATFQLKLSYNVDKLLCEGWINGNPMLEAQSLIGGVNDIVAGVITLNWQGTTPVTFSGQATVCELVFTPKEPGQGELTWYTGPTDSYFFDLDGIPIPAQFFTEDLEIYEPPSILLAESKTVCEGDTITIFGIATSTYPPVEYLWTNPDGSTQATDPFLAGITQDDAGDYVLLVTDSLGCTDQKAIRLVVSENPVADFYGTDTLTVPPGYLLEAGTGQASYLWNTGESTENITIDTTGLYWVEMESHVGCIAIDSIFIIVSEIPEECLFIPNAFTPNGDGLNDTFKAVSICPLSSFHMAIFNRWGEEMFESGDLSEGWDGKYNGTPCSNEAYVYKISYKAYGAPAEERDNVKTGVVVIVK
jgi:gliding motility-associated-like protein